MSCATIGHGAGVPFHLRVENRTRYYRDSHNRIVGKSATGPDLSAHDTQYCYQTLKDFVKNDDRRYIFLRIRQLHASIAVRNSAERRWRQNHTISWN